MEVTHFGKCRGCLSQCEDGVSLFDIYEHNFTLAEILHTCLKTEVKNEAGLPKLLCSNCVHVVTQFYNFMVIYEECDNQLRAAKVKPEFNNHGEEEEIVGEFVNPQEVEDSLLCQQDAENLLLSEDVIKDAESFETFENKDDFISNFEEKPVAEIVVAENNHEIEELETIKKYVCDICGEENLFEVNFVTHMRLKHSLLDVNPAEYRAEVLMKKNKELSAKDDLNQLPSVYKVYKKCNICNEEFYDPVLFHKHSLSHMENKKYVCDACGARFVRKTYLVDHMEGHSEELKHECKFCGKAFRRRTVLRAHKRVHTHPNHYVCELCGRAFTNHSTLRTHHLLIHVRERNFKCVRCELTFPLKSTLKKHILRHQKRENGEKGFDCTECTMQYCDKSSLKRHMQAKHQGKVYPISCPVCPKSYVNKTNVLKHMRKHHPGTVL